MNYSEARSLVEQIQELASEKDATLMRIRKRLIEELRIKFDYVCG